MVSLRRALAELYLQGGLYGPSIGMFRQAVRFGQSRSEMLLGQALAHAMDGKTNLSNSSLQDALSLSRDVAQHPRFLAVRARMELNLGRIPSAGQFARRALEGNAELAEAHLVLGEIARRRRRDAGDSLRAALRPPRPQPRAAALLALELGATEEGCSLVNRYLECVHRRAEYVEQMESLRGPLSLGFVENTPV